MSDENRRTRAYRVFEERTLLDAVLDHLADHDVALLPADAREALKQVQVYEQVHASVARNGEHAVSLAANDLYGNAADGPEGLFPVADTRFFMRPLNRGTWTVTQRRAA